MKARLVVLLLLASALQAHTARAEPATREANDGYDFATRYISPCQPNLPSCALEAPEAKFGLVAWQSIRSLPGIGTASTWTAAGVAFVAPRTGTLVARIDVTWVRSGFACLAVKPETGRTYVVCIQASWSVVAAPVTAGIPYRLIASVYPVSPSQQEIVSGRVDRFTYEIRD